ncbi:hypothetical protein [Piscirickettsia litoralis]|uniref:Uncharacterized protein n=1 Tax=Piscirickettsia litoralis TaxID=1891921 RepID=A0ABX3A0K8_9GAMM|nr:hypothetical protein [Piscirickettsia litoralis]ODN41226.1 hypothetical protein BGC07_17585 [Piscirickettsia litoralis]
MKEALNNIEDSLNKLKNYKNNLEGIHQAEMERNRKTNARMFIDSDPKIKAIEKVVEYTEGKISEFRAGNTSAFKNFKIDPEVKRTLESDKTTAKLVRAIAINVVTLGAAAVCTRINTRKDAKSFLPFYNSEFSKKVASLESNSAKVATAARSLG